MVLNKILFILPYSQNINAGIIAIDMGLLFGISVLWPANDPVPSVQ